MLIAVLTPLSIGGCASMQAPTGNELSYPNSWPKIEGLGTECKDLEGDYENDGVFIDSDGVQNQLSLIDLFSPSNTPRVGVVHLVVITSRKDPNQDTIGSLQVIADGDQDNTRRYDSFLYSQHPFLCIIHRWWCNQARCLGEPAECMARPRSRCFFDCQDWQIHSRRCGFCTFLFRNGRLGSF